MPFAFQGWTENITLMQQSVLISSVRGPDGLEKDHTAKMLIRWLRRCFIVCAFENKVHHTPDEPCGGSFTGPSLPTITEWTSREPLYKATDDSGYWVPHMDSLVETYMSKLDGVPHHFQLHFMHAAEILGYKHPRKVVREWWCKTYVSLANDMHLLPEPEEKMDYRLSDREDNWRQCEEVTAKPPEYVAVKDVVAAAAPYARLSHSEELVAIRNLIQSVREFRNARNRLDANPSAENAQIISYTNMLRRASNNIVSNLEVYEKSVRVYIHLPSVQD